MTRLGFPDTEASTYLRAVIARSMGDIGKGGPVDYARTRWGVDSDVVEVVKADVQGGELQAGSWGTSLANQAAVFLELVDAGSIIGKLPGLRRVPANTPYVAVTSGPTAYWRGQSKGVPCSTLGLTPGTLSPLSLGALIVVSNTLLESNDPKAEALIRDAMVKAIRHASDFSFVDQSNAGVPGVEPPSITNGVSGLTSTGDLAGDIGLLLEGFGGDLQTSAWIMSPSVAAQIVLSTGGVGLGADLGLRGGQLLGLPAIVSSSSEHTSSGGDLVLVDAARVVLIDEGINVVKSNVATVEMSTLPTGATDTPVAMSQKMVSLYQDDATAFLATRRINWVAAAGAVAVVSGIAYGS
jgi:HK97 family phage major capsid protein